MVLVLKLVRLLLLVLPLAAAAQSQLPPCPADINAYWHNCFGTYTADGDKYVGEFKDGKRSGQGTYTFASGEKYVGEYKDDKRNGRGTLTFGNGDKYVGAFKDGKPNGQGIIYADIRRPPFVGSTEVAGSSVDPGRAKRDRLAAAAQSELRQCQGTWPNGGWTNCIGTHILPWGEVYVGHYKDGARSGEGIEYRQDGRVNKSGYWVFNTLERSYTVRPDRYPFDPGKKQREADAVRIFSDRLNSSALRALPWKERLDRVVQSELRDWLTPDAKALEEVSPPTYPAALALRQEVWETNREFEGRVTSARAERSQTIDRLQAEYRERVEERNRRVSEYKKLRHEREAKLVERRRELIVLGIEVIAPAITLLDVALNQQTGDLIIASVIEGLEKQVFSFSSTSQAFRRAALTEPKAMKVNAEFQVSDSGEVVLAALNVEAGGVSARGLPSTSSAAPVQLASVTIASTPVPVIAQQSAVTVDRNQVEQILYREENDSLRKRLEDQRRQQEQAVANAEARAAAEIARIRAEADAERKKLAEARPVQNIVSVQEAHALVIGNSAYRAASRLANPVNDATAMSAKLRSMGFKVTEISNASREQMVRGLSEFSKTAARADLTLLFYAGHGVQIQGINYMVPIDMSLSDPSQATLQAVSLTQVVEQYLPGKTKLVFLDACRDNPLMNSGLRGVARGLAPISVSEGTLISYATKDGQTAEDGVGSRTSPFTTALLEHLGDPNDIAVVLRKVREKVMQATGGKQQPWEYGSLTGGELVLSAIRPQR